MIIICTFGRLSDCRRLHLRGDTWIHFNFKIFSPPLLVFSQTLKGAMKGTIQIVQGPSPRRAFNEGQNTIGLNTTDTLKSQIRIA